MYEKFRPQKIFLVAAIIWGTLTVFLTPPFQVPDEPTHFFRAYQVASGNFMPVTRNNRVGGYIPVSMQQMSLYFDHIPFHADQKTSFESIRKSFALRLDPGQTTFVSFPNTSTYVPFLYLPQALVLLTAKLFNTPPLIMFYTARLFNFYIWLILVFFAVCLVPVYKWLFMLLALMPMSVFQAASLSPDALTNGAAFLFIAIIFRLVLDKSTALKNQDIFYLAILLILLTFSRYAYGFLYFLFFMIPAMKAGSPRRYLMAAVLLFTVTFITLITGGIYVRYIYDSVDPAVSFYGKGKELVQPYAQFRFMLADVALFLKTLLATFPKHQFYIHSFIGTLGWLDTPLPVLYTLIAMITLIITGLGENSPIVTISAWKKSILLFSISCVIVILSILLYLSWTPLGGSIIEGLQGRYFIPVAPLIFSLFYNRYFKLSGNTLAFISISYLMLSFLVMNYALVYRYYLINA